MSTYTSFVVIFLWMQFVNTVAQFEGGFLNADFGDGLGLDTTEAPDPLPPVEEEVISKVDLVGDPDKFILSAHAIEELGVAGYNDLISQVVEDPRNGPRMIKTDNDFVPRQNLYDRHLQTESDGEFPTLEKMSPENGSVIGEFMRSKRAAYQEGYLNIWQHGFIPYIINLTDEQFRQWILAAADWFKRETCVEWVPRTDEAQYVSFQGTDKKMCAAYVGKRPDAITPIYLHEDGGTCRAYYVIFHEMLHVMGSYHEQSRRDRSDHLKMDFNCIEKTARANYLLTATSDDDSEYDLESMMQYSPNLFRHCVTEGKYAGKTMAAKLDYADFLLFKLVHEPTHYDKQAIVEAYNCNNGCDKHCYYGGFVTKTVTNSTCHCVCTKYFSGDQCSKRLNAEKCGSHTVLETGKSVFVSSDGYDKNYYVLSRTCVYLFTSPPGTRIELSFVDLAITKTNVEVATCVHFVEVRVNLMGQDGPEECGFTHNRTYVTSINSESHMAALILNTERGGSINRGFKVKATAFISECLGRPCKNGGTCTDIKTSDGTYTFHCNCPSGFSDVDCTYVASEATVGCDMETGVSRGICCMEEENPQVDGVRFHEYRPTSPTISYAYIYATGKGVAGYASIVSSVTFEPAYRCLQYYVGIITATYEGVTTTLQVSFTSQEHPDAITLSTLNDTSAKWHLKKATLPKETDVKVRMTVTKPKDRGVVALNNIKITPGACYVCDSSPCLNGGTCSESTQNDKDFDCSCPAGFLGDTCEIEVCKSSPCLNGGECVPTSENENGFTCNCGLGYLGLTCDQYVCDPSPCQNGGICDVTDTYPSQYTCTCIYGYYGLNCEKYRTPFCSFENPDCDFRNSNQDSCDWTMEEGPPATRYTGPRRAYDENKYLYVDASANKRKMCRFELIQQFDDRDRCIVLFYSMSGAHVGTLRVNIEVNDNTTNLWSKSGNQGNKWRHALIDVSTSSSAYTAIQIEAKTNSFPLGDIAIDNIQMKPYPCSKIKLCPFENGLPNSPSNLSSCVRLNPEVDFYANWRVREGQSQSNLTSNVAWTTGPKMARSGYRYAFIDSSYNVSAAMEVLHNFEGPACFSIGYYMFGNNVGTLYVKLVDENGTNEEVVWSKTGQHGKIWLYEEFDIPFLTNKRLIITADKGQNTPDDEGDIAIDDIMVVNLPCGL